MKLIISGGSLHVRILWSRRSVTALGNAPSMSRKRAETTFPCLQACHIVVSRRCSESVVERPGQPPKCMLGNRLWVSRM